LKINKALIVYKRSVYQIYRSKQKKSSTLRQLKIKRSLVALKASQVSHNKTLQEVKEVIDKAKISYKVVYRAEKFNYKPYDLIVTVGGDGTFLEAARNAKRQIILGVNSDPNRSSGAYCAANRRNFKKIFNDFITGRLKPKKYLRLQLKLNGKVLPYEVLNDILISHPMPAAMSRYLIQIGNKKDEHRCSGLWISTASGSTGAMKSAGGKVLSLASSSYQYRPRELYRKKGVRHLLKGGVLDRKKKIKVESLMREASIYVDGTHLRVPIYYADVLEVSIDRRALQVLKR